MDTHTDHTRTAHHTRPPETWDEAREDYLAGAPAPNVCARYGIGLSTFRDRARKEGWRRADLPAQAGAGTEPFDIADELDENGLPPGPGELAADAWTGVIRTIRHERPREAHAWLRLYRALSQLDQDEEDAAATAAAFRRATAPARKSVAPPAAPAPVAAQPLALEQLDRLDAASLIERLEAPGGMDSLDEPMLEAALARLDALAAGAAASASSLDELDDLDSLSRTRVSDQLDDLDDLDGVSHRPASTGTRLAA